LKADSDAIKPFTKGRAKNPSKMEAAEYTTSPETGCPIIAGAAAYLECKVVDFLDVRGDHDLVIGEVVGASVFKPGEPQDMLTLPHLGWSYAG
ncbi:MAG TPA: flavin reductase, partial [Anaerolineales bacterium]|nr:flavin reductase [Anaerolineales bacterium]